MYHCSAIPCVPELFEDNLAPQPADKSDDRIPVWGIHHVVKVHIPCRAQLAYAMDVELLSLSF